MCKYSFVSITITFYCYWFCETYSNWNLSFLTRSQTLYFTFYHGSIETKIVSSFLFANKLCDIFVIYLSLCTHLK
jgi:hypothetical protein